jgi:hypothetical protein
VPSQLHGFDLSNAPIKRGAAGRAWLSAVLLFAAVLGSTGCERENEALTKNDKLEPSAKNDKTVLDGMQLSAARRVGLESAVDGLARGDLQRLKMLRQWALGRAQVVLFSDEDMAALDLGIACLDGSLAPSERPAAVDRLQPSQLRQPARALCLPDEQ